MKINAPKYIMNDRCTTRQCPVLRLYAIWPRTAPLGVTDTALPSRARAVGRMAQSDRMEGHVVDIAPVAGEPVPIERLALERDVVAGIVQACGGSGVRGGGAAAHGVVVREDAVVGDGGGGGERERQEREEEEEHCLQCMR